MPLIEDKQVHVAFDYLNGAADAAAKARMNRFLAERNRKTVWSNLYNESNAPTVEDRKNFAESHPEHKAAWEAEGNAIYHDEWHRAQRDRANAIIEAWRTEQANLRGATKVA